MFLIKCTTYEDNNVHLCKPYEKETVCGEEVKTKSNSFFTPRGATCGYCDYGADDLMEEENE